ncbi:hypothetical protein GMB86_00260 [Terrilactibacillus sp. BCM23-1]|uniref:Putative amidase domain-containing protein n=1 Tax=Terrilactibacillus tamarindi TaxID=2599694 RepID=A0A6N8CNN3_9BACI|nr:amidase domain-containing protein [Terrilactibacillus tamarindi]MTT30445.1 hypothetical protein [Terrilactibacillus tamarindi]
MRSQWLDSFNTYLQALSDFWVDKNTDRFSYVSDDERQTMQKKKQGIRQREASIVKAIIHAHPINNEREDANSLMYHLHTEWLIKQRDTFYVEEAIEARQAYFDESSLLIDKAYIFNNLKEEPNESRHHQQDIEVELNTRNFTYDRLKAVRYAERWWNSYNPAYKGFSDDCTNFVSQCIRAGNVPMVGKYNRGRGWWYEGDNWSYSWTVANSLRWYLSSDKNIMGTIEVSSPEQLVPGDIICYDFNGDGRWDHNTFVTSQDAFQMPLVNAHTINTRHRYWAYEDSPAYTKNIQYKFFHVEDQSSS